MHTLIALDLYYLDHWTLFYDLSLIFRTLYAILFSMIGKAFTGNAGALSKVGITMSEEEVNAIKFGDANERAATIAKVFFIFISSCAVRVFL